MINYIIAILAIGFVVAMIIRGVRAAKRGESGCGCGSGSSCSGCSGCSHLEEK